jgi:anti-anti-sigma regulatory factor
MSAEGSKHGDCEVAGAAHADRGAEAIAVEPQETATLVLPQELTIYQVSALGTDIADRLASGSNLELDGSAVIEVDAAGIQLLLASRRHAAAWDRSFSLAPVSAELSATLTLLGLDFANHPALPQ